jgi:hypothetical protein
MSSIIYDEKKIIGIKHETKKEKLEEKLPLSSYNLIIFKILSLILVYISQFISCIIFYIFIDLC